jgi:plasmid stabilization system protein ParE
MVKKISWNKLATLSLSQIAEYLESEASYEIAIRFVNLVYDKIDVLKKYPEMGRRAPKTKTVRFIKIDKNRRMYYRKNGATLHIVWFFDTRQDPNKNRY